MARVRAWASRSAGRRLLRGWTCGVALLALACQGASVGAGSGSGGAGGVSSPIGPLGDGGARAPGAPTGPGIDYPGGPAGTAPDAAVPDGPGAPACACTTSEICVAGQCRSRGVQVPPGFDTCAQPPCINVLNNCPIPLWTHAVGTQPIDDGQVRRLGPGERHRYTGLPAFGGGRLYAYYKEPEVTQDRGRLVSDYNQFVEMTIDRDDQGRWAQNYNVSYVDYLSLPVAMQARGPGCAPTRCGFRWDDWVAKLRECPTDLRWPHGALATCTASYNYCISREADGTPYDVSRPYCRKMEAAHGHAGSAIYGGVFPQRPAADVPFWDAVAAWNRGTFAGDASDANYYQREPYNHYAAFVHRTLGCDGVYAFSTDDHQDKAGFVRCTADELDIVWCPNR